ncbi:MAG: LapA family protein [Synergistaceae bacterium]|nr:LapA family protein [Synergistaceae bacterium]
MKSYIFGIVMAMILSAAYALSNTVEITIKFLTLQTTLPQGIWEVIVFGLGALIMLLASVFASIEMYVKNRKKTKELTKRITQLEDERKSLLVTLQSFGWKDRQVDEPHASVEPHLKREESSIAKTVRDLDFHREPEPSREPEENVILDKHELSDCIESQKNADAKPSFLKKLISSVFKREKKPETKQDETAASDGTDAQMAGRENVCSISESTETDVQTGSEENVCLVPESEPEPAEEEYGAQTVTEIEDEEKSRI